MRPGTDQRNVEIIGQEPQVVQRYEESCTPRLLTVLL